MSRTGGMRGGRRVAAVAMGLVAVLALSACQNWTQFMGGAAHTGDDSGETTITTAKAGSLHLAFTIPGLGQLVTGPGITVSAGNVYAATPSGLVVSSLGSTGCSGTPTVCQPLWTAPTASFGTAGSVSQPTVADGMVYMTSGGQLPGDLRAFDANGVTNCSGTPTVCQPLWTAAAGSDSGAAVDGTTLLVSTGSAIDAFDANGVTNCSGTPTVCQPLWTASTRDHWIPTIADGKVYVATGAAPYQLEVFDEAGSTGCGGVPVVCQPLFTAPLTAQTPGSVDVSGGVAYVQTGTALVAVDAAGTTGCGGVPVVCQPLWTAPSGGTSQSGGSPTVADGHVFATSGGTPNVISVFDAAGVAGCSGTPVVCNAIGSGPFAARVSSPLVGAGVVWVGGQGWDESQLATSCSGPPLPPCGAIANVGTSSGPSTISIGTLLVQVGTSVEGFQT